MEQVVFLKKSCLRRILLFAVILLLSSSLNSFSSYASSFLGIEDQFDGMSGSAKYAGKEYRDNYRLDIESLGILETGTQMMADFGNGIWMMIYYFSFFAIAVFYHALSLDFSKLLSDQIQTIQAALHDSIFQPLLMIAIVGTFAIVVLKYARRDFSGLIGEFFKVFLIMILSMWLVKDSAGLLSGATNITKGLCTSVLSDLTNVDIGNDGGIKLGDGTELYAQQASGALWGSLIHQSWLSLEFGDYKASDEEVEQFLTANTTEKREELVKKVMEDNPKVFSKDRILGRIAQASIMFVLIIIKSCIYAALGVLQIVIQIIAIVFVLLASVILFLALIPSFGFEILELWAKKIFETQLSVLLLTFIMGFMILISNIISSISGSLGWMVGLLLEVTIGIGLFRFRAQIFSMFSSAGKAGKLVLHPSALKHAMQYGMSPSDFYPGYGGDGPFRRNRRSPRYQEGYDDDYDDDYDNDSGNASTALSKSATTKPLTYNQESLDVQPQESGSYYATYEESSNWRDEWYGASRPTTESEKSMKRASIKTETSPDLKNDISQSVEESQAEGVPQVKRPLAAQERHEVELAEDGRETIENRSPAKTIRPVIEQGQSREGNNDLLESSSEENKRVRPRIEVEHEVGQGKRYDGGLERENESQDYSPEEYNRQRPRIEEAQIYEGENQRERYNSIEHENESQNYSPEEHRSERPRIEREETYEGESQSEKYDNHFVSAQGTEDHSPEEHQRERPWTEDERINEEGGTDRKLVNHLKEEPVYSSQAQQGIYIDGDNTKLSGIVEEPDQERPRIESPSYEKQNEGPQEATIRPQTMVEGIDDENHMERLRRHETPNMDSGDHYGVGSVVERTSESPEEKKIDVKRPNINTESSSKHTKKAQESIPEAPAGESAHEENTSPIKPKMKEKGELGKKSSKEPQSKRRLLPKKRVEEDNNDKGES